MDAIAGRSVFTKSQTADTGGTLFNNVQSLAEASAAELSDKLPPFDPLTVKRDNRLDRLIYRLNHPPQGFLDTFAIKELETVPEFDIDTFDYDIYTDILGKPTVREYTYEYLTWGKKFTPAITVISQSCSGETCKIENNNSTLVIARDAGKGALKYTFRFHNAEAPKTISGRWWVTMGYPVLKSLAVANQQNPAYIAANSPLPLNSLQGLAAIEGGYSPARWQLLPLKMKWAATGQALYGQGNFLFSSLDDSTKLKTSLLSLGVGLRIDRPFVFFSNLYTISPLLGFTIHYQRFSTAAADQVLNAVAFTPEIGINQSFRFYREAPWRLLVSTVAGAFLYSNQNLSYLRVTMGVEYAIK